MREIKFRVWDKIDKKFINPYDGIFFNFKESGVYWNFDNSEEWFQKEKGFCDVEIQQFTGLKDKNGKGIYEGDVVKFNGFCNLLQQPKVEYVQQISWDENQCGWNVSKFFDGEYTVLGNIFENQELIK